MTANLPRLTLLLAALVAGTASAQAPNSFEVTLRRRAVDAEGLLRVSLEPQTWRADETAVVVCDMWDAHHCLNAVLRVGQLAPVMNRFLHEARRRGAVIIHAPSECMAFYADHPARKRAQSVPRAASVPENIGQWCHWKDDQEQQVGYPIDHSDGGEDDDMFEHWRWHEHLRQLGRNPNAPWKRQTPDLEIDAERDYITDDGVENWSILKHRGIKNVMLVGVHTNMCVLGRPFGLRQLANNGVNVVLVRDLTDTMYNPDRPPYVSHFSGTDLVVEHIEQYVCPTITSNQVLGGSEFRFPKDHRPHLAFLIGEDEYETEKTLPQFARKYLARDFRLSFVFASPDDPNAFPGIEVLSEADVLVVSVRRRTPPADQLEVVRSFVAAGKPVVGIRTASHAFALRDGAPPEGYQAWPEFDQQVFGGNYHGHYGRRDDQSAASWIRIESSAADHPIVRRIENSQWPSASWLYKTGPLAATTTLLLTGKVDDTQPIEAVAWTNERPGGGRAFYTSLGHPKDFDHPAFRTLLMNGIYWAAGLEVPSPFPAVARIP